MRTALVWVLVLLTVVPAWAQSGRATVRGLVTDASGAVVPLAEIAARNEATGVVTTSRSDAGGLYSLLNLPIGRYTITFTREKFGPFVETGVDLGVSSALTLDVRLQIGGLRDEIKVSGDTRALDTRSAAVGARLDNATVTTLPLSITGGRSIENFAYAIVPGVEGTNYTSNIVGGVPFSKEVLFDGTSASIQMQGHISESSPPMEAVEEFRVETSGMPAEYGRTGGGVFNFSLRSGTNAVRGSAYGQFRDQGLNANTWINTRLAAADPTRAGLYAKPQDRQRLGGASAGGPIRSNKTFYFASFEEYRQTRKQLGAYDRTVPTTAFLDGNFSALLDTSAQLSTDAAGSPIYRGAIIDPRTGLVFPGNIIPANRISPVSQQIVNLYRQSYQPMANRLSNNSAGPAYPDPAFTQHQVSVKIDHAISPAGRLSGSLIWTKRPRTLADQGGVWDPADDMGGALSKARESDVTTYQARLSHSQVLSPSILHVGTITFNRFRNPSTTGSASGDWPTQLGLQVAGAYGSFPQIDFGDAINGINETAIGYGISNFYVANVYQYNDTLSWVKGRHLLKAGGEARFTQMNSHGDRGFLEYHFSPGQTGFQGGPLANQVGFGFASFLLGEVQRAAQHVPSDLYGRRNNGSLFVQDDYRVGDNLTLDFGLRWESTGGWHEKYGRWANFNVNRINPTTGVAGVLEYADEVNGSFEGKRHYNEFGPRIGAAYHLNDRTTVRAAYGVFYAPIGTNFWSGVPYGFAPGFFGANTVDQRADGTPAFNWDQTAYPGSLVAPAKDPAYTQWGMVSISPDSLQAGRIQQWNAGIEREIPGGVSVGANYLGNTGNGLPSGDFERNQPDPAVMRQLLVAGTEWNPVSDPASAAAAAVPYPYRGFSGPAWMAITPYPQAAAGYGPLFFVGSPLGHTDYRALQLTAGKRGSRGVSAAVNYTLSRQRGDTETAFQERWTPGPIQDVTRLDEEARVIGSTDRTHVAKGYLSWSLPFGPGRRFLNESGGVKGALAGGWTISGIFRYESGLPLAVRSSNSYGGWAYPIYANRTAAPLDTSFDGNGFNVSNPADPANRYFNPAAFANPAYGDLGTGPARFAQLRGFGAGYEDLGIVKNFKFGRYTAQVKLDILNLFNRHYFADPETNLGSPYFGQVTGVSWQSPRQGQLGVRFEW